MTWTLMTSKCCLRPVHSLLWLYGFFITFVCLLDILINPRLIEVAHGWATAVTLFESKNNRIKLVDALIRG